jgi:hypothetical protein
LPFSFSALAFSFFVRRWSSVKPPLSAGWFGYRPIDNDPRLRFWLGR